MPRNLSSLTCFFFFNGTPTYEIYTLSLHDALPILHHLAGPVRGAAGHALGKARRHGRAGGVEQRSEEHTSELQSHSDLVCRLLLEKKKAIQSRSSTMRCKSYDHELQDASPSARTVE